MMIFMVTLVPDILASTGPVPAWPGLIRSTTGPGRPYNLRTARQKIWFSHIPTPISEFLEGTYKIKLGNFSI